jgi:hypothetical protein
MTPVPIVQEAGWVQGPVWTGMENFAPIGIRSPGRPAVASRYNNYAIPVYQWKNVTSGLNVIRLNSNYFKVQKSDKFGFIFHWHHTMIDNVVIPLNVLVWWYAEVQ